MSIMPSESVFSTKLRDVNDDNATQTQQVTQFKDSSDVEIVGSKQKFDNLNPYFDTTLIQFLERPFLIDTINWTTTTASGGVLTEYLFPENLFVYNQLFSKLINFSFFKANVRISFRINATRFHYGKLLVCVYPNGLNGLVSYNHTGTSINTKNGLDNIISASQFQHIEVTPTCNCVSELVIPYTLPFPYINIETYTTAVASRIWQQRVMQNIAVVRVFVLNPLQSNDATVPPVSVNVYANFEDVQVAGYSASGGSYITSNVTFFYGPNSFGTNAFISPTLEEVEAQSEAGVQEEKGVISTTLRQISKVSAGFVNVPIIGTVAESITYFSKLASSIAAYFGYSLPNSIATTMPMRVRYMDFAQTHGVSPAISLSTNQDNEIAPDFKSMGSYENEMLIADIIKHPSLVLCNLLIPSTNLVNTMIFTIPVKPMFFARNRVTVAPPIVGDYVFHTPLSKVASCFQFWRGTINYRIEFVASTFHSCRFRIEWHPTANSTSANFTGFMQVINKVVDISTDSVVDVSIPYLSHLPYLVNNMSGYVSGTPLGIDNTVNGYLVIRQLTILAHQSIPIPSIAMNIWVSGGPDMQFAKPTGQYLTNAVVASQGGVNLEQVEAQSYEPLIPATSTIERSLLHGEQIASIKNLIMRSTFMGAAVAAASTIYAWYVPPLSIGSDGASFLNWFMTSFRWAKGSTRYKLIPKFGADTGDHGSVVAYSYVPYNSIIATRETAFTYPFNIGKFQTNENAIYFPDNNNLPREISIPFYSQQLFLPVNTGDKPGISYGCALPVINPDTASNTIMFSAGDDFILGNFTGSPCYYYPPTIIN